MTTFTTHQKTQNSFQLQFTGNWYIDLGILGVKNLFFEVDVGDEAFEYSPDCFKKIFLIVFLTKIIGDQIRNNLGERREADFNERMDKLTKILSKHRRNIFNKLLGNNLANVGYDDICDSVKNDFQNPLLKEVLDQKLPSLDKKKPRDRKRRTYFQFVKDQSDKERLLLDSNFYKNFKFFNPSGCLDQQKSDLKYFINGQASVGFGKDINKFLPSFNKFPNTFFVDATLDEVISSLGNFPSHIFYSALLSLPYAFFNIGGTNYAFYSPDLNFSFAVNLKLKRYLEAEDIGSNEILKVTWSSILDTLIEYKSEWSLNNMYLISYRKIGNEGVEGVEYIGVDKIKVNIILDDKLRENLNRRLRLSTTNKDKWLIMEYIKGNSLLEICINYVKENIEKGIYKAPVLTALAVEGLTWKYKERKSEKAFMWVAGYVEPGGVKEEMKRMRSANDNFRGIIGERKIYYLFNQIKGGKKDKFINSVLKLVNGFDGDKNIKDRLVNYVFDKILYNKESWRHYGLALILP